MKKDVKTVLNKVRGRRHNRQSEIEQVMVLRVKMAVPYGRLKSGHIYSVLYVGRDYYAVKACGNIAYVPKKFVYTNIRDEDERRDEEDIDYDNLSYDL